MVAWTLVRINSTGESNVHAIARAFDAAIQFSSCCLRLYSYNEKKTRLDGITYARVGVRPLQRANVPRSLIILEITCLDETETRLLSKFGDP